MIAVEMTAFGGKAGTACKRRLAKSDDLLFIADRTCGRPSYRRLMQ